LLYHPEKDPHPLEYYNLPNTEEIFITTADNIKIQVWYHKPLNGKEMVIFLHGNAGNIPKRIDKLKVLTEMGYGFIIPAWRGFGKSEGSPSKEGLYNDARAAIEFAQVKGYKTEDMIIVGESLGSGIATYMAIENKFKGVFLITPYTSIKDRGQEIYFYIPVGLLIKDNFDNAANISKLSSPVFIIHGDKDNVIPHSHSLKLIEIANQPKKLILYPGVGHANYEVKTVFTEMKNFFNSVTRIVEKKN
jgi:fermentation-respiration switch protein FrsA (DUF1100 family)